MSPTAPDPRRHLLVQRLLQEGKRLHPLSPAQQGMWFLSLLGPTRGFYTTSRTVRLTGPLDAGALGAAIQGVVDRHELLRTSFPVIGGEPVQLVAPALRIPLPVVDLRRLPVSERQGGVARIAAAAATDPFDLGRGPLVRARLLRVADEEHVLVLVMHHLVTDGWSTAVLLGEISELYRAALTGRDSRLPDLPWQYGDYARWQRERLAGDVLTRLADYWRRTLAGAPGLLPVPTDLPRPAAGAFRGGIVPVDVPAELAEALAHLARSCEATPVMAQLAVFAAALGRWSGAADVVVGVPMANRPRRELEPLIGLFANTLPLRCDLSGDPTFRELLRRVRETAVAGYNHQDLPFGRIVEELRPVRDLSYHPVFQVALSPVAPERWTLSLPGVSFNPIRLDRDVAPFDLTLLLDGRSGYLSYDAALFEADTAARMGSQLLTLLGGVVADPDRRLSQLPLMTPDERQVVTTSWSDRTAHHVNGAPVHELVRQHGATAPDTLAAVRGDQTLTYGELLTRAERLAHQLRSFGVGLDDLVAVCMERSAAMVVAMLGTLLAGSAYAPVDVEQPARRLASMLGELEPAVVLTQRPLRDQLPRGSPVTLVVDDTDEMSELAPAAAAPLPHAAPDSAAYVIHTSGSTGAPKGAVLPHRALTNLCAWYRRAYGVGPGDVVAWVVATTFDVSVLDVWGALAAGATLALPPDDDVRLDPGRLLRWFAETGVTVAFVVTPLAEELLQYDPPRGLRLRWLLTGGELLRRAVPPGLPYRVADNFGPTECGVVNLWTEVVPGRGGHVGGPIDGVRVLVVDEAGQPAPIGVPGELLIGGAGLGRGYLRRPDLTAERFVPPPGGGRPGERMYRSGDLARWRADGNLEVLGRIDRQVKVRGFRVELAEIEAVLLRHPSVKACAVVVRPEDRDWLAAYVVPRGERPSRDDLLGHLSERLPRYMLPRTVTVLDDLPATPTGKIDRSALPVPERAPSPPYEPPVTDTQRALTDIWQEVLGVPTVGLRDDFFELGGHSLTATRVLARVRSRLGAEVSVRAFLSAPTIVRLADEVELYRRAGSSRPAAPPMRPLPREVTREETGDAGA